MTASAVRCRIAWHVSALRAFRAELRGAFAGYRSPIVSRLPQRQMRESMFLEANGVRFVEMVIPAMLLRYCR